MAVPEAHPWSPETWAVRFWAEGSLSKVCSLHLEDDFATILDSTGCTFEADEICKTLPSCWHRSLVSSMGGGWNKVSNVPESVFTEYLD